MTEFTICKKLSPNFTPKRGYQMKIGNLITMAVKDYWVKILTSFIEAE